MKGINFKVGEDEHRRLVHYMETPEGGRTIIANFIRDAIREKCERLKHLRAGGLILTIPNPDITPLTADQKAQILSVLKEADLKLSRVAPGMLGLSELIAYLEFHFFRMTDLQRKNFQVNAHEDEQIELEIGLGGIEDGKDAPDLRPRSGRQAGDRSE